MIGEGRSQKPDLHDLFVAHLLLSGLVSLASFGGLFDGLLLALGHIAGFVGLDVLAAFEAGEADHRNEPVGVLVDGNDDDFL